MGRPASKAFLAALRKQRQSGATRYAYVPSNDEPSNVQEEIEAARLAVSWCVPVQWQDGYYSHLNDRDPPEVVGIGWRAGWLGREIATWTERDYRDADAWPWDPSRPVAGQYEEWVAHMARGDAMLDELIEEEYATEIQAIKDVADTKPPAEWQGAVFAAVDTASREPWRADGETQLSEADRAETKLRESADAFAELVTVVPDGAA